MRFKLTTLVDITNTGDYKKSSFESSQQANFNTVINTLGLRANPLFESLKEEDIDLKGMGFGSNYRGEKHTWTMLFNIEQDGAHSVETMIEDFHVVPIITGLGEEVTIDNNVFNTKDSKYKNIVFDYID